VRREIRRTRSVQSLRNMASAAMGAAEEESTHIPAMSWTRQRSSGVWSPASSPAIVAAKVKVKVVLCVEESESETV